MWKVFFGVRVKPVLKSTDARSSIMIKNLSIKQKRRTQYTFYDVQWIGRRSNPFETKAPWLSDCNNRRTLQWQRTFSGKVRAASGFLCSGMYLFFWSWSSSFFAAILVISSFIVCVVGAPVESSSPRAVSALAASMMVRSFSLVAGPLLDPVEVVAIVSYCSQRRYFWIGQVVCSSMYLHCTTYEPGGGAEADERRLSLCWLLPSHMPATRITAVFGAGREVGSGSWIPTPKNRVESSRVTCMEAYWIYLFTNGLSIKLSIQWNSTAKQYSH